MDENSYLVYEQDEVELYSPENEETNYIGKLRIIDKADEPVVEWFPTSDDSSDGEWAVISPNVSFANKKNPDCVSFNNSKKPATPFSVQIKDNFYLRVTDSRKRLELLNKEEKTLAVFIFHNQHSEFFFDVLRRYITIREQEKDPNLFLLQNKRQADIDDRLSALNLVPKRSSPKKHPKHYPHGHGHYWTSEAPRKVWGFIHNMKKDPYTTTLATLSKVYDVVLYSDYQEEAQGRDDGEEVGEFLQRISGMDDLEPGYEIVTKREKLADRPYVERLPPLSHEEFEEFVDTDGRILQVKALKERIFRGGIHFNLRSKVWCFLLGFYDWQSSSKERKAKRKEKEAEYNTMKQQWKTFSEEQERNFSGFRDRKSIIEKDVNRTDRNHPFYEGESNDNVEMLSDILMTYIMYNFDLGYVQGMSDLLSPILYVMQNEAMAFWCFVGYMERVHRNFDLDQSGMKQQLSDLSQVLRILDPEFVSFLEAQDCANLYFCFRWLLVRFKRELNYADTLRLWEVLWTDHLCSNFHLCVAASILDTERDEIVEKKFGFTDVLKHINGLSLHIDLDIILKKAEAIYLQLQKSASVPNSVRLILGLPAQKTKSSKSVGVGEGTKGGGLPGHVERIMSPGSSGSEANTSFAEIGLEDEALLQQQQQQEEEINFEKAIVNSYI